MTLGARLLREWRLQNDKSQLWVATQLSCSPVEISTYECGRRRPGRKRAVALEELTEGAVPASSWEREPGDEAAGDGDGAVDEEKKTAAVA